MSGPPEILVMPLGGCGEMGMNATLYVDAGRAVLVDCGVQVGGIQTPVIDKLVSDFEAVRRHGRSLEAVVLTHGHLDHIGGVPALLRQWQGPIYGPPLALELLRARLQEEGRRGAELREAPIGSRFAAGPFEFESVHTTHSIPDNGLLAVRTRAGMIVHSGDFKLDLDPVDGRRTDERRLRELGDEGVSLLLSDSTNSERPGRNRTEREVEAELEALVRETEGCCVVSTFSTHVHRLSAVVRAARLAGRRIALVGRSQRRMFELAMARGEIDLDRSDLVDERRMAKVPRGRLLLVVSGSQGEPRAGLSRLAAGELFGFSLRAGDRVVLSARVIPGSELQVRRLLNRLVRGGVEVVLDRDHPIHTSGHATREEQAELISWLRPAAFVPMHGDRIMLEAHARTAASAGVPRDQIFVIEDGESVILAPEGVRLGPTEEAGRQALGEDGSVLRWGDVSTLQELGTAGALFVSVLLGPTRAVTAVRCTSLGFELRPEDEAGILAAARAVAQGRTEVLEPSLTRAIGAWLQGRVARRPLISVHCVTTAG